MNFSLKGFIEIQGLKFYFYTSFKILLIMAEGRIKSMWVLGEQKMRWVWIVMVFGLVLVICGGCEQKGIPPDPKLDESWIASRVEKPVRAPEEQPKPSEDQKQTPSEGEEKTNDLKMPNKDPATMTTDELKTWVGSVFMNYLGDRLNFLVNQQGDITQELEHLKTQLMNATAVLSPFTEKEVKEKPHIENEARKFGESFRDLYNHLKNNDVKKAMAEFSTLQAYWQNWILKRAAEGVVPTPPEERKPPEQPKPPEEQKPEPPREQPDDGDER